MESFDVTSVTLVGLELKIFSVLLSATAVVAQEMLLR